MKVIAFNGSPRPNGNTAAMLREVLRHVAEAGIETELVQVGGALLHGCKACGACAETKDMRCAQDDDPVNGWIQKMAAADGILFGSPSYFSGMTPELKALMDRAGFVAVMNGRAFARKVGAAVCVHRRAGGVNVMDQINHMMLMSRMIVPGSTYWNLGVGRLPGEAMNDAEALANMKDLGGTIAWLLQKMNA
ncbi:MAG: flavodoxin family protein [Kiritimatiellaeota bacterium]|nr:flavodoxin family protein [Kiritimatiellota bacterium]